MRVTKNKLKAEFGAFGTEMTAAGTPTKSGTSSPVKNGTPASGRKRATPAKGKGGKRVQEQVEVEEDGAGADGVGSDGVDETPSKKAKTYDFEMAAGTTVKAEPSDEGEEDEMFH